MLARAAVGLVAVGDEGQRVDLIAVEQHIDLDELARAIVDKFVIERGIALGACLERVEKVVDDLVERHFVVQLDRVGVEILHILKYCRGGPGTVGMMLPTNSCGVMMDALTYGSSRLLDRRHGSGSCADCRHALHRAVGLC